MSDTLREIIREAFDLHVHVGPEIIPRRYTASSLLNEETGKIAGCVLKNHFYPVIPPNGAMTGEEPALYGSIVLNNFVGGLNPHAVYAAALASPTPLFVWLPTLHTAQFLSNSEWEIPLEWVGDPDFRPRCSREIAPVLISRNGSLCDEVLPVLRAIADLNAVLCSGHISWQESILIAKAARDMGISKIVVTHPIYQKIDMPIAAQIDLANMGCFIEHCYSMHSIDKIPIDRIVQQIRAVGSNRVVLSSDVGQTFSPSPSEALYTFARLLLDGGIPLDEIRQMCCNNPKALLAQPPLDQNPKGRCEG